VRDRVAAPFAVSQHRPLQPGRIALKQIHQLTELLLVTGDLSLLLQRPQRPFQHVERQQQRQVIDHAVQGAVGD
jgi:hypothetical protein